MSARCKVKSWEVMSSAEASKTLNIDTLTLELRSLDSANYDHINLGKVFGYLSLLSEVEQNMIIKTSIGHQISFEELMTHVQSLYVIQEQSDQDGQFCGMGFGNECTSVATWDGLGNPKKASDVETTKICYKNSDGTLRCSGLLDFAEFWMTYNKASFEKFCACLKRQ